MESMTPRAFGEKIASNLWDGYKAQFEKLYGIDPRFPHDYKAMRQMLIAAGIGGTIGLARGSFWPGYHEKLDAHGNVIAKKRRSPWQGAAEGALIGAGTSALSNYAGQTMAQYNPEIDRFLSGMKHKVQDILPVARPIATGIDVNKPLFDRISQTV